MVRVTLPLTVRAQPSLKEGGKSGIPSAERCVELGLLIRDYFNEEFLLCNRGSAQG